MGEYVDRGVRKDEIQKIIESADMAFTTYELCKIVGLKYSGHFRQIVQEMYREHRIDRCIGRKPNGMKVYYWLDKNRPNSAHQIAMEL